MISTLSSTLRLFVVSLCVAIFPAVHGAQTDIAGPPGSASFGAVVKVLPNGNFVVVDTYGPVSGVGSVYLYSAKGTLISTLTGSSANDGVGNGGVYPVAGGNFVVASPSWNNGAAMRAGAVTWVNGSTGLNGVVSTANSLVGTATDDKVGSIGITVLKNGNYVVLSPDWHGGIGAVTWVSGASATIGTVSAGNSLVGSAAGDMNLNTRIIALNNGNYVVSNYSWHSGGSPVGAVTWGDGATGISGPISATNSLVGSAANDCVGCELIALSNGNYVVDSWHWHNGLGAEVGAVTWADGQTGINGTVSTGNSLVGTSDGDTVGLGGLAALSDGNYAVGSRAWNGVGAATWGDGVHGTSGIVSAANSLIGTTTGDFVGGGVTALKNGNYVVDSSFWHNGGTANAGAATWVHGGGPFSGTVSASNSLVGTTNGDYVGGNLNGFNFVTALSDGNYVVVSSSWNNGAPGSHFGAVTWGDGTHGTSGVVSVANSLIGAVANDYAGANVTAVGNGSYVVASAYNDLDPAGYYGALTWCRPGGITRGTVSALNSLVGGVKGDQIGIFLAQSALFSDGNYVFSSPYWGNGQSYAQYGAVTLASSRFRLKGTIASWNSVIGGVTDGGDRMNFDYDAARHRLIVGRPSENIVSLFTMDQLFADDFEP